MPQYHLVTMGSELIVDDPSLMPALADEWLTPEECATRQRVDQQQTAQL